MRAKVHNKLLILCILLFCLFVSMGCSRTEKNETTTEPVMTGETQRSLKVDGETEKGSLGSGMGGMKEVYVYSFLSDTFEVVDVAKIVPEERKLTAEYVVELVLEEFSANSLEVEVLDVTEEDGSVIVDFDGSTPPCTGVESSLEEAILDCVSHSLLDNVENCRNVFWRMDGQPYKSEHLSFKLDESYE